MTAYTNARRHFTSRNDGLNRRKGDHLDHNGKSIYFPSKIELKRAAELIMLERLGKIGRLKFHPRFDLVVEGLRVGTYVADSQYLEAGKMIVEDVKPEKFMTDVARLKIRLFDALHSKHGLTVRLLNTR